MIPHYRNFKFLWETLSKRLCIFLIQNLSNEARELYARHTWFLAGVHHLPSATFANIRSSEKFLSFYEEIIEANVFCFILFCRTTYDPFCPAHKCDISQTWFHVCMKVHCCKKHVCERKTLPGQSNNFHKFQHRYLAQMQNPNRLIIFLMVQTNCHIL